MGEPIKRTGARKHRSQRADDWAHADLDVPAACVLCGTRAMLRNPYTNQPCHLACAQTQATQQGEPW